MGALTFYDAAKRIDRPDLWELMTKEAEKAKKREEAAEESRRSPPRPNSFFHL